MIRQASRSLGYYTSSRWFPGVVAVVLVVVFVGWLFSALQEAQALAEKMMVEQTVQSMRTGLKVAMGEAVITLRDGEMAGWVGSNPVRWLASPPLGYSGACRRREALEGGAWCFDDVSGELAYRPRYRQNLKLAPEDGAVERKDLRWKVVRVNMGGSGSGFAGLRVHDVTVQAGERE